MVAHARVETTADSARKLSDVSRPSSAYPAEIPELDPAQRPLHPEQSASTQELNPGDRVEVLGSFGKPTGELGTIRETTEDNAVVKWDDDGSTILRLPLIKKI
jgi:hypothetical protein